MLDDVERPRHERVDLSDPALLEFQEHFARAVAALTQGQLSFPAPFDLVTSWALARNDDNGAAALEFFARDVNGFGRRFQIRIHELPPDDQPGVGEREIVDCIVTGTHVAAQLLAGAAAEIIEGHED